LSQANFAKKFEIPVKSLQNWEAGRTTPPPYVIFMIKTIFALEGSENDE
jgi:DNA-binding transcriptional regulator YiaG